MDSIHSASPFLGDSLTSQEASSHQSATIPTPPSESPLLTNFGGLSMTHVSSRETISSPPRTTPDFSRETSHESLPTMIEAQNPSPFTLTTISPSTSSGAETPPLEGIEKKKFELTAKIRTLRESAPALEEPKAQYLKNLTTAFSLLEESIALSARGEALAQETSTAQAIVLEQIADTTLQLSEAISSASPEGVPQGHNEALKEAQNTITYYGNYLDALKRGATTNALMALYEGYSKFSAFKKIVAEGSGNVEAAVSYNEAAKYYQEASNAHENRQEARASILSKIALFFYNTGSADEQEEKEAASLYRKAGSSTQLLLSKFSYARSRAKSEAQQDLESSIYYFAEAAKALQLGQKEIAVSFEKAGRCYYNAFAGRSVALGQNIEVSNYLTTAGFHFSCVGEALQKGNNEEADTYRMLGDCLLQQSEAIKTHANEHLDQLQVAVTYFDQALPASSRTESTREASKFYKKAGLLALKAAATSNETVRISWDNAATSYAKIADALAQGALITAPPLQLFQTAAKYGELVAQALEETPNTIPREALSNVIQATSMLKKAARASQAKDEALTNEYASMASSYYYLATAQHPPLVEHLPEAIKLGFRKDAPLNANLITYWKNAVAAQEEKLAKASMETKG